MFKYYLKLALRNLQSNKLTKGVKIAGMAMAIAVSMIIFLFVNYELNYDRFFSNHENVYRLSAIYELDGIQGFNRAGVTISGTSELKEKCPEIKYISKIVFENQPSFHYDKSVYECKNVCNVDSTFFKIFNLNLLLGNPDNVLNEPNCAVLSSKTAKRVFGNKNPLGETIMMYNRNPYIVTGVFEDFPSSSHLSADIIKTPKKGHRMYSENSKDERMTNYVLLHEGTDIKQLEEKINNVSASWFATLFESYKDLESFKNILQPVTGIHTQPYDSDEQVPGISIELLKLLMLVAAFIIMVAWLNHMNISINQRFKQIKLNSIDKVFGMEYKQQFLKIFTENLSDFAVSCLIALFLITILFPEINHLLEKEIDMFSRPQIWLILIAGIVGLSFLSAFFESALLSKVSFTNSLKGQLSSRTSRAWIKKSVLIIQYAITVVLVFFTAIVYMQSKYLLNKDLGMEKENILLVSTRHKPFSKPEDKAKKRAFLKEINKIPELNSATFTRSIPGSRGGVTTYYRNDIPGKNMVFLQSILADEYYLKTFQIELIAGENLKQGLNQEQNDVIIDRTAVRLLGYEIPSDAVGQFIIRESSKPGSSSNQYRIVGVAKDFDTQNFGFMGAAETGNIIEHNTTSFSRYLAVNYSGTNPLLLLKKVEKLWNEFFNEPAVMYHFLNDSYREVYKSELIQRRLFLLFAFTAILIACFGLFAMAFETIVQRTKEIGIRKVNGAKIRDILNLLFSDYIRIIVIAVLPGLVIGYFISSNWLKEYAIKIPISWYFFIIPLLVLGCITLVSVLYHSYKAAVSNPIEALKYE